MLIKRFTITSKVMLLSVILVTVTSTIVGAIFYYDSTNNISQHAVEQLSHKIQTLQILVNEKIQLPQKNLRTIANSENIKLTALAPDGSGERFKQSIQDLFNSNDQVLNLHYFIKEKNKQFSASKIADKEIQFNLAESVDLSQLTIPSEESLTIKTVNENGQIIIIYTIPVRVGNMIVGFLKASIDGNKILGNLIDFSNKQYEFSFLTSSGHYLLKGKFVTPYKSELPTVLRDFPELKEFLNSKMSHAAFTSTNYHPLYALYSSKITEPGSNGTLAIILGVYNYQHQMREFDEIRKRTIISSFLMIILSSILSVVLSKFLTRGLTMITDAAKSYMEGHEDVVIPAGGNDEISVLANTFQGMIHRVNERTRRIKRSEEKSLKAKEQAEEAQQSAEDARIVAEEANHQKGILLDDLQLQKERIESISKDKDDLMAIVSHDLKNPLAVIESSVQLIRDTEHSLNSESVELLMRAQASAHFAINLITDLLDLARLEGGIKLEKDKFNIKDLFAAAIYAHELPAQDKRIALTHETPDDFTLFADYTRILQILNNLIGNALKFTSPSGSIHLKAFEDQNQKGFVHITLTDNGRGIPKEKVISIFNKYEQAQSQDRKTGTGLGLAICHQITSMHEGQIYVDSKEGEGSVFHLILPGLEHAVAYEQVQTLKTPKTNSINPVKKILLIDDSEDIEVLIRMMLNGSGVEFEWANDGRSGALAYMKGRHELILMDLNMPVMNGLKTTQVIRAMEAKMGWKHATILAITASSDEESKRQCLEAGCNGTLNKPIKKETLLKAIGHLSTTKKAA